MDRFEDASEPTTAPPVAAASDDRRPPSLPLSLHRMPMTTEMTNEITDDVPESSTSTDASSSAWNVVPPRPLPPMAFKAHDIPSPPEAAPPQPMPPRVLLRVGPAFETENASETAPASANAETRPPSSLVDAVLSEIDAEAAARSLNAIENPQPAVLEIRNEPPSLGSLIPAAPRLEMTPPHREPSFADFRADALVHRDPGEFGGIAASASETKRRSWIGRSIRLLLWIVAGGLAAILLLMCAYRFVNPPASMLMLQQWLSGQTVVKTWVPIDQISPNVVRAVIASEDARFCEHNGVDFAALKDAVADGSGSRGASTISMQVVKNLFLWSSRSYVRKAVEMPLTFVMEALWPKRRIMEVYLNIAEWGPGIFGIEAASRFRFRKPASHLSASEASLLAVALPNPKVRNPAKPGAGMRRLSRLVQFRMRLAPNARTSCVLPRRRN